MEPYLGIYKNEDYDKIWTLLFLSKQVSSTQLQRVGAKHKLIAAGASWYHSGGSLSAVDMAAVEPAARLSRGKLVSIASQEAVKTYLAGLPKEVVETVDTALLVNDGILPVHQLVMILSSAVLRDLLFSQASALQGDQVQMVPLIDDGKDCVQDALGYMYQRISMLSIEPPEVDSILEAKHMVKFGHKYGVKVLLDEGDAFISKWCKTHLPIPHGCDMPLLKSSHHVTTAAQEVIEWVAFAEATNLRLTLVACESWFVRHIWDLVFHLDAGLSGMLAQMSSDVLARIMSAVATKDRAFIDLRCRAKYNV